VVSEIKFSPKLDVVLVAIFEFIEGKVILNKQITSQIFWGEILGRLAMLSMCIINLTFLYTCCYQNMFSIFKNINFNNDFYF
jgi:hypothetical protein